MALELTDYTFDDTIKSDKITVVDFWAAWCGPCRMMAPVIDELAKDYAGRAVIAKLDVDAYGAIAARYAIRSIPAILYFRSGQLIGKDIGACSKETLVEHLKALMPVE